MTDPVVAVRNLTKIFRSFRREEGLGAALKSLVRRTELSAMSRFLVAQPVPIGARSVEDLTRFLVASLLGMTGKQTRLKPV